MAASEPSSPELSVNQFLSMSDNALAKHIAERRRTKIGYEIFIRDWTDLSVNKRSEVEQKLRLGAMIAVDVAESRPVDLDQVNARLEALAGVETEDEDEDEAKADSDYYDYEHPRVHHKRPKWRKPVPTPPEVYIERCRRPADEPQRLWNAWAKIFEVEYYHDLVQEGGLPCYPIGMLDNVFEDPDGYRDLVRPWMEAPFAEEPASPWWLVFVHQWQAWEDFRKWRLEKRGVFDVQAECSIYIQKTLRRYTIEGVPEAEDPDEELATLRREFEITEQKRHREQLGLLVFKGKGLGAYEEAVKKRLVEHGVPISSRFKLELNPACQDKLTTWTEYHNYECCRRDKLAKIAYLLRPAHDKAWKKLVDLGVLRPGDTEEVLRTMKSSFQEHDERTTAERNWKSVQASGYATLKAAERITDNAKRERMLDAATDRVNRAKERLQASKLRSASITQFLKDTLRHWKTLQDIKKADLRLEWIRSQMSLVEVGMEVTSLWSQQPATTTEPPRQAGSNPVGPCGTKRTRDDLDETADSEPAPKKQRRNSQATTNGSDEKRTDHFESGNLYWPPSRSSSSSDQSEGTVAGDGLDDVDQHDAFVFTAAFLDGMEASEPADYSREHRSATTSTSTLT